MIQENEFGLNRNLTYNRSFFHTETMNHMAQHFQTLLNQIAYHPEDLTKHYLFDSALRPSNKDKLILSDEYIIDSTIVEFYLMKNTLVEQAKGQPYKTPIIFIHPLSGTGCRYLELSKALSEDQPCYLIQDTSIDAHHVLFDNMSSMANGYNHILLKHNPASSCILAGYAFGALLAIEMVKQLERKNLADCVHSIVALDLWFNLHHEDADKLYDLNKISKKIVLFNMTKTHTHAIEIMEHELIATQPIETHCITCEQDALLQWPQTRIVSRLINQYIEGNIHAEA